MDYHIVYAQSFKKCIRRLEKKYRHVRDDVRDAIKEILQYPRIGPTPPGWSGARKHRVANTDAQRGKSGGYRLVYLVEDQPTPTIYLLLLYSKSDQSDVSNYEIEQLLSALDDEFKS
jgi:mRNA-degrading endonuclease RelE of RelBE toxin-antitoxin system